MELRFNHMEITFPMGTFTNEFRADIDAFYGDVFGFTFEPGRMFGQNTHLMRLDNASFILLIEGDNPLSAPGFDHLGLEPASRTDVDETLAKVKRWQQKDDRVRIKEYPDGVMDGRLFHAYYLKYLLPIWFDVQYSEPVSVSD